MVSSSPRDLVAPWTLPHLLGTVTHPFIYQVVPLDAGAQVRIIPESPSQLSQGISYSLQGLADKTVKGVNINLDVSIGTVFLEQLPMVVAP